MAQWQRLLSLDADLKSRVCRLYYRKFPIEIRRCLCDWVEGQDWEYAAADEATARMHFQTLLLKLDELIKDSLYNNHTLTRPDFSLLKDHVLEQFERSPLDMAAKLSECLQEEKMILDFCVDQQCSPSVTEQSHSDLDNKMKELENWTQKIDEELNALEKVELICKTWESEVQKLNGLASTQMQEKCLNQAKDIITKKQEVISQIVSSVNLASQIVQKLVSVELPEWKRKQQMSCIGNPVCTSLEQLEKWFSAAAESLLQIIQQLKKLEEQSRPQINPKSNLSEVLQQIHSFTKNLLTKLMENSLVVEKQPVMHNQTHRPLVLRTNTLFNVKLRLLANLPSLQYGCIIRAEFDKDVKEIKTIQGFRQFAFTNNNTKVMVKNGQNGGLEAEWDMSIAEIKSKRKRSNESPIKVTEELHIIHFSTDLQFSGMEYRVETSSLPLVVVSTTTQGPSAWASVLWYNLCPPQHATLSLFMEPSPLSWEQLSQALSWQFISAGDRELNQDQLHELKLKIVDNPEELVYWSKFSNQKRGPWIWIDAILDLIQNHLKNLWRDGCIMGFVSKQRTKELLQSKQSGNFLLRFSESNRDGAITFSWVDHTENEVTIHSIEPFTKEDLSKTPLPDIVKTYRNKGSSTNPLLYLYPDQHRDHALQRYYSKTSESTNNPTVVPYVKRTYICEGDCPSPPPAQIEMDFLDISTLPQQVLPTESFEELLSELYPENIEMNG